MLTFWATEKSIIFCVAPFGATFGKTWATFYFNIRSHCTRPYLRLVQMDCVKRSGIESFLTPCVFRMRKNRTTLLRKRMRITQV